MMQRLTERVEQQPFTLCPSGGNRPPCALRLFPWSLFLQSAPHWSPCNRYRLLYRWWFWSAHRPLQTFWNS